MLQSLTGVSGQQINLDPLPIPGDGCEEINSRVTHGQDVGANQMYLRIQHIKNHEIDRNIYSKTKK